MPAVKLINALPILICAWLLCGCSPTGGGKPAPIVWRLDNSLKIGGLEAKALCDAPTVGRIAGNAASCDTDCPEKALAFNGKSQGLLMPKLPIAGCQSFTIEVDIFPEAGGEFEQRFLHSGSVNGARAMLELRSNPDGTWYLDSYLRDSDGNSLALIDPKKTHPPELWYTVALIYDGDSKMMSHYVDGQKEMEGEITISPLPNGYVSLGVRQNMICWFKGLIREVRFWPTAVKLNSSFEK